MPCCCSMYASRNHPAHHDSASACCTIHQLHEQSSSSCTTASRTCHCSAHLAHRPDSQHQACDDAWAASQQRSILLALKAQAHAAASNTLPTGSPRTDAACNQHPAAAAVYHHSTRLQQHGTPHAEQHTLNAHIYSQPASKPAAASTAPSRSEQALAQHADALPARPRKLQAQHTPQPVPKRVALIAQQHRSIP